VNWNISSCFTVDLVLWSEGPEGAATVLNTGSVKCTDVTLTAHRADNTPLLPTALYCIHTIYKRFSCYAPMAPSLQNPLDLSHPPPLQNPAMEVLFRQMMFCSIFTSVFIFSLFSLFLKNNMRLMRSPCCLCARVSPSSLIGNGSVNTFAQQGIHTNTIKIELLDAVFSMRSVSYQILNMQWKESRRLTLPRTSCLFVVFLTMLSVA
jgi:hypothetical protein